MKLTEKNIVLDLNGFWVCDTGKTYAVMVNGVTHSTSDSEYRRNSDGLSIALARCRYLAKRHGEKQK